MDELNAAAEIGIGMLGYAFMGKAHANAYHKLAYIFDPPPARPRLVALAGRSHAATQHAARRYGFGAAYADWRELVADPGVQVLDNCGPNDAHAAPAIAAAEAGKHVVCEKPLGRDAPEAKRMLEAVRQAGVKHMTAFNYRFVPALRLARDLIAEGALGEIRHYRAAYLQDWITDPDFPRTWRLDRASAGSGALGDLGSHIVDLARFLVGEPVAVSAATRTFIGDRPAEAGGRAAVDVDDAFAATVEFENGALGTLEASRFALGRKNHLVLEVNGSQGSLAFNLERLNELAVYRADGEPSGRGWTEILVTEPSHPFIASWWPPGHVLGWEHTFVHELAHFLDAVANDRDVAPLGATFDDGYRAALVGDAILESARARRRVVVNAHG